MGSKRVYQDDDSGANPEVLPEGAPLPEGAKSEKPGETAEKSEADRLLDQLRAETGPEIAEGLLDQLKEETNERKRIELLRSMLTDQDVETLDSNLLALKQNPEVLDETKITALAFLTDELLYVLPRVMIEKPDLDPMNLEAAWMGIYLLKDPSTKKRDPRVVPLTKTLKYLREKRGMPWVKAYLEEVYPKVVEQARVIAPQVSEMVDEVRRVNAGKEDEKGAKTKIREMMEKNPILTTTGLVLGAYAGARLIHWMYKKLRERQEKKIAAGEKVRGQGFFGFMDKVAGVFDFIAKPALLASLIAILAGSVLGIDEVKKYLEKTGRAGIYENKAVAALIHFVHGRPDEAVATLIHGPRNANERVRQERYAKYFGVEEKHVWVLGPVKFKDFIDADPNRTTSLVSSKFGKLPILGGLFESPEQVAAEKKIRDFFTDADIQQIRANLDGADGKTMNEILQAAFFSLYIFDDTAPPRDQEPGVVPGADDTEPTPRQELSGELDEEVEGFKGKTEGVKDKDILLKDDVEILQRAHRQVQQELLDLQATVPNRMTEMKEVMASTFHSMIPEGEIDPADMVAAREQYNALFDLAEEDEKSAIAEDLEVLAEGGKFFGTLEAGKPLTEEQKTEMRKHIAKMNEVFRDIRHAIKDVKKMREEGTALDIAEGFTEKDVIDGAMIWVTGYKQMGWGLLVDAKTIVDPKTGLVDKGWSLAGLAFKGLVLEEGVRGAHMLFTGGGAKGVASVATRILGAANIVVPGIRLGKDVPLFLLEARNGLRYSQKALLEQIFSGKMGRHEAADWARRAKSYTEGVGGRFNLTAKTPFLGGRYATRLSNWGVVVEALEAIKVDDLNRLLTHNLAKDFQAFANEAYQGSYGPIEKLHDIVTKQLKMDWGEFVDHVRKLNAESGGQITESTPSLLHKSMARFLYYSRTISEKLGLKKIPDAILKRMHPDFIKFVGEATKAGLSYSVSLLMGYAIINMVYEDKDKADGIALALSGLAGASAAHAGYKAVAGRVGVAVGSKVPGPVWAKAVVGFIAAAGVTIGGYELGEHAMDSLLKNREGAAGVASSAIRGSLAPALHTFSAGAVFDMAFWAWNDDMKQHFMAETFFLDTKGYYKAKPAFGLHRDAKSAEAGISMWNADIEVKIAEAQAKGDKGEVAELRKQIINDDWVDRSIAEYNGKKARISSIGESLYEEILSNLGEENLTAEQKAFCKSILVDDIPDTWIEDEYRTADDDKRYVLVKSFVEKIDEQKGTNLEDELESFVTFKRDIDYDKKFYGVIGMTERVVSADESEVQRVMNNESILMAALGLTEEELHAAQEVLDEMEAGGGMDEFELMDEAA